MALTGQTGATAAQSVAEIPSHAFWFGEDQGRYVVATSDPKAVQAAAERTSVPVSVLGTTGGSQLTVDQHGPISLAELSRVHEAWLPDYMAVR